jgi:hypothetical protein
MKTTRRTLLRAGGLVTLGALAGCISTVRTDGGSPDPTDAGDDGGDGDDLGGSPDAPGNDGSGDGAGDTRPRGTGGPGVALVSVDEGSALSVRPSVAVTRDTATAEHPPQLRVAITNEGDRSVRVGEGRAMAFEYVADADGHLILLPAGRDYPAEPDCWRLEEGIATTEEYRVVDLGPGESSEHRLDLYGTPGEDACLPVGEFRFETTLSATDDAGGAPDADGDSVTWGFSLVLE